MSGRRPASAWGRRRRTEGLQNGRPASRQAARYCLAGARERVEMFPLPTLPYCTVTSTPADGIPFATTCRVLAPVSIVLGTSKLVDTGLLPVATAIVL